MFRLSILIFVIGILFTNIILATQKENSNIQVVFNPMMIIVNGEKIEIKHLIYNDKTYVPLREITKLLGKELIWDGKNNINIIDGLNKIDGHYSEHENLKTAFLTEISNGFLNLEFQLRNTDNKENIIKLNHPYYNFIIYDQDESEIYNYKKNFPLSIPVIEEEKITRAEHFKVNNKVELKDLKFNSNQTYKVVFSLSFKDEENQYTLWEKSYFRIPMKIEETYIDNPSFKLDLASEEYQTSWRSHYKYDIPISIANTGDWEEFLKDYPPEKRMLIY